MKQKHWTDAHVKIITALLVLMSVLLVACAVCLVILLTGGGGSSASDSRDTSAAEDGSVVLGAPDGTTDDTQAILGSADLHDDVILPETPDAGLAYQDKLVFVGDSLTAHMVDRGGLTGGVLTQQVWRTQNNMLNLNSETVSTQIILPDTKEKVTVAEAAARVKPEILIITLGLDWGVAYLNEADFKACYTALVEAVKEASPKTTVILQSIFPIAEKAETKNLTNEKIDVCNEWVKAVADACECPYLDTQSVLRGEGGELNAEYAVSDGIHLTAEAYQVILQYIRTHAYTD